MMRKSELKRGILCLLEDRRGRTLEEIQEFLKANGVTGFEGSALTALLEEMCEEDLIEQRLMADGADTVDFAIEEDGIEVLKRLEGPKKWDTGRPDPVMQGLIKERINKLDEME